VDGRIVKCRSVPFAVGLFLVLAPALGCGGAGQQGSSVVRQEEQRPARPDIARIWREKDRVVPDAAVQGQIVPIEPVHFCEGPWWFEIERGMQADEFEFRNRFR